MCIYLQYHTKYWSSKNYDHSLYHSKFIQFMIFNIFFSSNRVWFKPALNRHLRKMSYRNIIYSSNKPCCCCCKNFKLHLCDRILVHVPLRGSFQNFWQASLVLFIWEFLQLRYKVCMGLGGPGGRYSQNNWVGVCSPLPKTLTLFMISLRAGHLWVMCASDEEQGDLEERVWWRDAKKVSLPWSL